VKGGGHDQRAVAAVEIAEGCPVEENLVVHLGRHFRPSPAIGPQRAPVFRAQEPRQQVALDIALQKPPLIFIEQLVAVQSIGERGEAAAGHAGDHVDLVQQPHLLSLARHQLRTPQLLEHAIGEGGGARAASGKGEDDEVLLVVVIELARCKPITAVPVDFGDGRIDRTAGATGQQQQHGKKRQQQNAGEFHGRDIRSFR
jgi:hypothetical protein